MDVILLEHIDKLGRMGETVRVKTGFARNYLLPQKKALRATETNIAYFESQKAALEKLNTEKKKSAEDFAKKIEGMTVMILRHASEAGVLYGSVTPRDIAESLEEKLSEKIERQAIVLREPLKTIGLFTAEIALHPEVKIELQVNIARSEDEANAQVLEAARIAAGVATEEETQASEAGNEAAPAQAESEEEAA